MSRRQMMRMAMVTMALAAFPGQRFSAQEAEGLSSESVPLGPPLIAAAQMSVDRSTLTVLGLNLGSITPTVSMGLSALAVTGIAPAGKLGDTDVVTTALPADVPPGTYLLALTRGGDEEVAIFYLAVPPVGAVYQ